MNKIMEDHAGSLHLASIGDADIKAPEGYHGAIVILRFAIWDEEATG